MQAGAMIEAKNLSKRYGDALAVDDVSFHCEPGTVTGFLGPNGAGKSTTMRMVCGLTRPTTGSAAVTGVPYHRLPNPGREVGVLLDASAMHDGRTGRETLALSTRTMGIGDDRVEEMLRAVELDGPPARRRVRGYSLGMRQRLGIAHALLGDPRVLILDEPANGLDPEGIAWMRGLLRDFADRGGTVLLSSHLLREVEAVADRIIVIGGGRLVASGRTDELLAASGVLVRALDPAALEAALTASGIAYTASGAGAVIADADAESVGWAAAGAGVVLLELRPADSMGLEAMFFQLTSGATTEDPTELEAAR
jgi:ABC-2 type transport system ATP-binding protein